MSKRPLFLISILIISFLVSAKAGQGAELPRIDVARLYPASKDAIVVILNERRDTPEDTKKQDKKIKSRQINPRLTDVGSATFRNLPYVFFVEEGNRAAAWSMGTGFFVREDGVIVTSYHVVEDSKNILVQLADGSIFTAQMLGFDDRPEYDIAVLKITTKQPVKTLKLARSNIFIGMPLLLIGHPYFLTYTSSSAEISNLDPGFDFIQVHSSIHPGNSGSPLVNGSGEAIGVVYARIMNSETQGLATPAAKALEVIDRVLAAQGLAGSTLNIP